MVMIAQRRWVTQLYSAVSYLKDKIYSFRFDQAPYNAPITEGVEHFVNVAFSFQNISGVLGNAPASYKALAERVGVAYVGFVAEQDPNAFAAKANSSGSADLASFPEWPPYGEGPMNMVMNATASYAEPDTFRAEGIAFLQTIFRQVQA